MSTNDHHEDFFGGLHVLAIDTVADAQAALAEALSTLTSVCTCCNHSYENPRDRSEWKAWEILKAAGDSLVKARSSVDRAWEERIGIADACKPPRRSSRTVDARLTLAVA
jgi:hypothetical protein